MEGTRFNKNVKPQVDWQGRVTGYKAERVFPNLASASRGQDDLDAINPAGYEATPFGNAGEPFDPPEVITAPPPCEGFGGEYLAHAQHEAAIDGDECTSGACLLTRGSD